MSDPTRYAMLICSLPHHGSLFRASRPPLSRFRLYQFLHMLDDRDKADHQVVSRLLDWYHQDQNRSDAELIADAHRRIPGLFNPMARDLVEWRLEMRSVLAALRHRQRGKDRPPEGRAWAYGRWVPTMLSHWDEPDLGVERVYPWISEARSLFEAGDSLGLERLLLSVVWQDLGRRAEGHEFDFEAVLIYCLRWDLIARWTGYREQPACTRFEHLVREGLSGMSEDFLYEPFHCLD